VCQLEGSDHGGRDSAAELALAGIDVQASDSSCNRLTLGPAPPDGAELYTSKRKRQRLCAKAVTIMVFLSGINDIECDSSAQTKWVRAQRRVCDSAQFVLRETQNCWSANGAAGHGAGY
jgi:hypothetical protein